MVVIASSCNNSNFESSVLSARCRLYGLRLSAQHCDCSIYTARQCFIVRQLMNNFHCALSTLLHCSFTFLNRSTTITTTIHIDRQTVDILFTVCLLVCFCNFVWLPRTCRRFGDRAFTVAAPRVWNSLPTDIKVHRSTTTSFKRRLKTILFNRGFAGYM